MVVFATWTPVVYARLSAFQSARKTMSANLRFLFRITMFVGLTKA